MTPTSVHNTTRIIFALVSSTRMVLGTDVAGYILIAASKESMVGSLNFSCCLYLHRRGLAQLCRS
jgi:hypothetical protein